TACANVWNFQDFQPGDGPDGAVSSTFDDATTDGTSSDGARESGRLDGDARDAASDGDGAPACATTTCNGACVDTMNDPKNCGSCGTACPTGAPCQGGKCICPGTEQ